MSWLNLEAYLEDVLEWGAALLFAGDGGCVERGSDAPIPRLQDMKARRIDWKDCLALMAARMRNAGCMLLVCVGYLGSPLGKYGVV